MSEVSPHQCLLCRLNDQRITRERQSGYLMHNISCPRCGSFVTSEQFMHAEKLENWYILSGLARELHLSNQEPPKIIGPELDKLQSHVLIPQTIDDKKKKLLVALYRLSEHFGARVHIDEKIDLSLAYARNASEFFALIRSLRDEGLIEGQRIFYSLTDAGWKNAEKIIEGMEDKITLKEPSSARIGALTPVSNRKKIADLIGTAKITAVFDPYLDNRGLLVLGDILSLGIGASVSLRLMSSKGPTDLTYGFLVDWLKEHHISGELRQMPRSEHSRFLLLDNGKSLRIGISLNGISSNNEAAHLDPDKEDLEFFDSVWKTAKPFAADKVVIAPKNPDKEKHAKRILEDWKDWQQEHSYDFKQQTRRGYRKIAEKDGIIPALISKLFKEFPTLTMIEKSNLAKTRRSRLVSRDLEDLGFPQEEIEKMIQANTLA